MKRPLRMGSVVALALALGGCPSNNNQDNANQNDTSAANANDNTSPAALYPGTWQRTGGTIFGGVAHELAYMVLNADATADFYYRHTEIGYVTCVSGLFEQTATMLTVAISGPGSRPVMTAYDLIDANTLELTDADGEAGLFSRATLPAEAQCLELTVLNTVTGVPRPHGATGLAYNGVYLFYTDADRFVQSVTLSGAPVHTTDLSFGVVHAYQDAALWLVSTTSDTDQAQRRNASDSLVDLVDTTDLGHAISVRALAYDALGHVLWLHGPTGYPFINQLLRVAIDAEPHVLLGADNFRTEVRAMAFDGPSLWVLLEWDEQIVQIDPATLGPLRTYALPAGASWYGMTWAEGALFLIGAGAGGGVLIQTQP